jgi:hypothetical protein
VKLQLVGTSAPTAFGVGARIRLVLPTAGDGTSRGPRAGGSGGSFGASSLRPHLGSARPPASTSSRSAGREASRSNSAGSSRTGPTNSARSDRRRASLPPEAAAAARPGELYRPRAPACSARGQRQPREGRAAPVRPGDPDRLHRRPVDRGRRKPCGGSNDS